MRPLPPRYPLADVVYYILVVGLIVALTFLLDHVWESLDIQMGRFRIYTNAAIAAWLSVSAGLFVADRFYKIAYLRPIYGRIPLSVRQSRTISLYGDFQDIYAYAVTVMETFEPRQVQCDPDLGIITARTKRGRWFGGQRIDVALSEETEEWVLCQIYSRPIVPTVYADRGINAINVEYFVTTMKTKFWKRKGG